MTQNNITALSLISYDFAHLLRSIPAYLGKVDALILGLDANRLTWSGQNFALPDDFAEQLQLLDPDKKITVIQDQFFVPGMSARELDTRERNILSQHAQDDSWLVSIDADEVLLNADEFFQFLRHSNEMNVCVMGSWIVVYKILGENALLVNAQYDGSLERFPIATRQRNAFVDCRWTSERRIMSPALSLHYSWGRTELEVEQKLRNWGHSKDFEVDSYLALWRAIDRDNWNCVHNLHPFQPEVWPSLKSVPLQQLESITAVDLLPPVSEITLGRVFRALKHKVGSMAHGAVSKS